MQMFVQKLYTFSCRFIQAFSFLLVLLLFLGSFLATCYSTDMTSQKVLTRLDHPLWNLAGTALFVFLVLLAARFLDSNRTTSILTITVLLWSCTIGAILIVFGRTVPAADAMSVYAAAEELAGGSTAVIHPTDSYLSYYPQQVGLVAFFELLIRLWNLLPFQVPAYHFIKCIYVLLACVIILFQKYTVRLLWHDRQAANLYLLLAALNLPFLMYTSFVYGEIPSFAAISGGLYFLLKLLAKECNSFQNTWLDALLSLVLLTLGVMLRKNNLILILAVLIVLLLQGLWKKRTGLLLFALLCGLCCFSILPLVQKAYESRAGSTLKSGVPAMSYLAMGMQEASRGNGWYNGFNFNTYQDTGMDTEATNALSRQAIRERLSYFQAHPAYAADFYLHKHLSQWADGTYACRQATLATFGGRSSLFQSLYEGPLSRYLIEYCNLFQVVLYLGTVLFCCRSCMEAWKQHRLPAPEISPGAGDICATTTSAPAMQISLQGLPLYLGLIGVIGGFLFHIMWEANSRYIFPYSLLMMPYCAVGLSRLPGTCFDILRCRFGKGRHKSVP